ncbi:aldose reductase-like [Nylanderia fulva]|uniref:aldose reductase-like n=1 Tax=Nylanderia fulva TaxID=613905 RepID=UPI0010FB6D92|nr:aldose reductase-like [Nylanderia fulva]
MAMSNKKIKLKSGHEIPLVGLGTWRLQGKDKIREVLNSAIELGYRHIDTAYAYDNEEDIGSVLEEIFSSGKVKRSDLFITSKLWNSFHSNPSQGLERSLTALKLEYLDLYLVHWPVSFKNENGKTLRYEDGSPKLDKFEVVKLWSKMERFVREGKVKSIGISNFGPENITKILKTCSIQPSIAQFEYHPYLRQDDLVTFFKNNNIQVVSYSSLGSGSSQGPKLLNDPLLKELAKKYGASTSQIILSFITQQNICVVPKSSSYDHLKSNRDLLILTEDDMERIRNINTHYRYVDPIDFGLERFN